MENFKPTDSERWLNLKLAFQEIQICRNVLYLIKT